MFKQCFFVPSRFMKAQRKDRITLNILCFAHFKWLFVLNHSKKKIQDSDGWESLAVCLYSDVELHSNMIHNVIILDIQSARTNYHCTCYCSIFFEGYDELFFEGPEGLSNNTQMQLQSQQQNLNQHFKSSSLSLGLFMKYLQG